MNILSYMQFRYPHEIVARIEQSDAMVETGSQDQVAFSYHRKHSRVQSSRGDRLQNFDLYLFAPQGGSIVVKSSSLRDCSPSPSFLTKMGKEQMRNRLIVTNRLVTYFNDRQAKL
jgi:hypothetical protein